LATFSELLYLGLTTFIGNRTLGEEYCDIVQVQAEDGKLPAVGRRGGYILGSVVLPYVLTKALPKLRAKVRSKLEERLGRKVAEEGDEGGSWLAEYVLENLGSITSPSMVYAMTLAVFYFTGSYYHLSKRLFRLRYIFTKRLAEGEQRVGYEVLGVLLVMQMVVQAYMHVQETMQTMRMEEEKAESIQDQPAVTGEDGPQGTLSKSRIERTSHTPDLRDEPRYDLKDKTMMGWIQGKQLRKCTLCLEEMKDPSVTTCGHIKGTPNSLIEE
ncbi:MAG: hypothetical protein L6R39_005707, partial [Caloplaca ligustica]